MIKKHLPFIIFNVLLVAFATLFSQLSNCFIDQTVFLANHCVSNTNYCSDSFCKYSMYFSNSLDYYNEHRIDYFKADVPQMYRNIEGNVMNDIDDYHLLESWPIRFTEEEKPSTNVLYHKVFSAYGSCAEFISGYSVAISTRQFGEWFPTLDKSEYNKAQLLLKVKGKSISANIGMLFSENFYNDITDNGKLYETIFGGKYVFVNSSIADFMAFDNFSILLKRTNYNQKYISDLVQSISLNNAHFLNYFSEIEQVFKNNLGYITNQKLTIALSLGFISLFILVSDTIIFFKFKLKARYGKYVPLYVLILFLILNLFTSFISVKTGLALACSTVTFGFTFGMELLIFFLVLIPELIYEHKKRKGFFEDGQNVVVYKVTV